MIVQQTQGALACTPAVQCHSPSGKGVAVPIAKCMSPEDVTAQTSIAIRAIPTPSRSLAGSSVRETAKLGFSPSVHSAQAPSPLTSVRCTPRSQQPTPRSPCSSSWAPPRVMQVQARPQASLTPPLVATPMKSWKPHPVAQVVPKQELHQDFEKYRSKPVQSQSWVPPSTPRREVYATKSWMPPGQNISICPPVFTQGGAQGIGCQGYQRAPLRAGASAGCPPRMQQVLETQSFVPTRPLKPGKQVNQNLSHCPSLVIDQRTIGGLPGCQTMVAEPYQDLTALQASIQRGAQSHSLRPCPSLVACPVYADPMAQKRKQQPLVLQIASAFHSRQHPAKMSTGIPNADAVLEGLDYVGIADGVSGVHSLGLTPDALPWELLRYCGKGLFAAAAKGEPRVRKTEKHGKQMQQMSEWLIQLIQEAFDSTEEYGATTLLLAAIKGSNLVTACLGDSGILILRPVAFYPLKLQPIFKTEPGRFDARRPVQIQRLHGCDAASAHEVISSANIGTTAVRPGDILILGTDGLFDNLSDKHIKEALERFYHSTEATGSNEELGRVASLLVDLAIRNVKLDKENADKPPWQCNAAVPANNPDDTTALVAMIKAEGSDFGSPFRGDQLHIDDLGRMGLDARSQRFCHRRWVL